MASRCVLSEDETAWFYAKKSIRWIRCLIIDALSVSCIFVARRYVTLYYSAVLTVDVYLCLAVTRRYRVETAKHMITRTTPHDSPGTLVF